MEGKKQKKSTGSIIQQNKSTNPQNINNTKQLNSDIVIQVSCRIAK